jgi:hypothetical protein
MKKFLLYISVLCMLTSCGVPYRALELDRLPYQNSAQLKDNVTVSYLYDIQTLSTNKRYGKKEHKAGYAAVGVRIKNESDQPIQITRDNFKVTINGTEKAPMTTEEYTQKVKQHPAVHLLHALWGPWRYSYVEYGSGGRSESSFQYWPVGAAIGVINMIIASSGNTKQKEQLNTNTIFGKTVEPNKTVNGVILMSQPNFEPLTFVLKEP